MGETILEKQRNFNGTKIAYWTQLDTVPNYTLQIEGPWGTRKIEKRNGDAQLIPTLYKQLSTTGKANRHKLPYEVINKVLSNNGILEQTITNKTKEFQKQTRKNDSFEPKDYHYKLVEAENKKASESIEEIKSRNRHNDWTTISYSYPYEYQ